MLTLKAIKTFPGTEGKGVACKLCWQGKHVADYVDYADGNEARIGAVDYVGFEALVKAYPNTMPTGDTVFDQLLLATKTRTLRLEIAIEEALLAKKVEKKAEAHVKRGCVVFRTPQQKQQEFSSIKTADRTRTMVRLRAEYPGALFFVAMPTGWAWIA